MRRVDGVIPIPPTNPAPFMDVSVLPRGPMHSNLHGLAGLPKLMAYRVSGSRTASRPVAGVDQILRKCIPLRR
jgi:hypothetical protein